MGRSVLYTILHDTVNSEIFARVLFSRNFTYTKFREIKSSVKWRNHCRLLIKENHALVANFYVSNMSYNDSRENKILAKISGFTVMFNCACSLIQLGLKINFLV